MCKIATVIVTLVFLVDVGTAQVARVFTVADSLVGAVGGIAIDRAGNIYSADFGDVVWRVRPDGRAEKFATGFYGASGNALDSRGILYQSNFYGNYISRVERNGDHVVWVDEGLNGPVGVAVRADEVFVNNCTSNSVSRIGKEGDVHVFASGPLFNCPNGITVGPDSALYVVNFSDGRMIRIANDGNPELFAMIPGGGNGHVTVARGNFYVTAFQTNRIFMVTPAGDVHHVAGTGQFGEVDGAPSEATFTFPNGIATSPNQDRVVVNDYINRTPPGVDKPPVPLANIRVIKLQSISDALTAALQNGGVGDMEAAYHAYKDDPSTASLYTEREVNAYGYALMNRGQLDIAIRLFELNAESYPNAFNVWDSLAEAYMNKGMKEEAIRNYRKSLELNPANQNAIEKITEIEGK